MAELDLYDLFKELLAHSTKQWATGEAESKELYAFSNKLAELKLPELFHAVGSPLIDPARYKEYACNMLSEAADAAFDGDTAYSAEYLSYAVQAIRWLVGCGAGVMLRLEDRLDLVAEYDSLATLGQLTTDFQEWLDDYADS